MIQQHQPEPAKLSLSAAPRRNLVIRADGKTVNVPRRQGHLFVCATGCCCGVVEQGHPPVPNDLYHSEWERRRWRNRVHLTLGGCLGPCPLSNVAMLVFDGRTQYFQSLNSDALVLELLDYVDSMLAADRYLPPPAALADLHFTSFRWEGRPDGQAVDDRRGAWRVASGGEEQAGFLFLTHSDTDLLVLEQIRTRLPADFPLVRAYGLNHLKTESDMDAFVDSVLAASEVIIVRLLGGRASFARGMERLVKYAERTGAWLLCLPGTGILDPELMALSTTGVPVAHEALAYTELGGAENYQNLLQLLSDHLLATGFGFDRPREQPRHGVYHPRLPRGSDVGALRALHDPARPTVAVVFYRSHYLSGNLAFVDALVKEIEAQGANALPIYAQSLKERSTEDMAGLPDALACLLGADGRPSVNCLLVTTSFAMGSIASDGPTQAGWSVEALRLLDVPVLQAITVANSYAQWEASQRGLSPVDTAMNVALPEFDGRIIGVPISFKETVSGAGHETPGSQPVAYVPRAERVRHMVQIALRFAALRRKPNHTKRIALILTNYNAKASRIGNAVGLDTPASVIHLLHALADAGYDVGGENALPVDGDALLAQLVERCSYDVEVLTEAQLARAAARVPRVTYENWFQDLPQKNRGEIEGRWGRPPGQAYVHDEHIALAGLTFGNIFVAIQPPRGYGMDPNLIYHQPDLPPPHNYVALYRWLRDAWCADALVHVGKHGTLEWLPGKGVGPSETCYPDLLLGDLPLVYPFIVNDPGEGAQAKRRTHAVIVDHLTPPMTTADTYGRLDELARLVDEYYQVEAMDPSKLPMLQQQIWELVVDARLDTDISLMISRMNLQGDHTHEWDTGLTEDGTPTGLADMRSKDFAHLVENLDGYLCELGGALIRGGLHTLGREYADADLQEMVLALLRVPNLDIPSLRAGVAGAFGYSAPALVENLGARAAQTPGSRALAEVTAHALVSAADVLDAVDAVCRLLVAKCQAEGWPTQEERLGGVASIILRTSPIPPDILTTLTFAAKHVVPALRTSARDETRHVLSALDGRYVPAGPSGAPTRGMAHILPTGRNFYGIDPRTMPSRSAWRVGQQLARQLVERHQAETGAYPETVGLSIWGTSAMRTHGDDIAQVFALLGVRPVWQPENQALRDVELVPLDELGRPRVDVVCRISGFFRDAFPHMLAILDSAIQQVALANEPLEQNPLRKRYLADCRRLAKAGIGMEGAHREATYRIFGSKPGTYGAGILPLIDEGNWQTTSDFAAAYINWGGYAYTGEDYGVDARSAFETVLGRVQIAAKNQDNREHDIFDSDDYLQFHGGMIATIRSLSGSAPRRYIGDSADPSRPQMRDLKEEALRVFRSRVVNPKWIGRMMEHGYKGALELAATVDYLFGYDATSDVLDDWQYEEVARTYVLDQEVKGFLNHSNPWALRDMSGRLLEAMDRGLWENPTEEMRQSLNDAYLTSDAELEARTEVGARG